jgi:stearoyl-CoA desaturase (delta-9 desaturase)
VATVTVPTVCVFVAIWLVFRLGVSSDEIGLFVAMYLLGIIGVEMGFHRYFSHRSFVAKEFVEVLLIVCGSMAAQGPLLQWVSNHRAHHRYTDNHGDPHSPYTSHGNFAVRLWHAHMGWLFSDALHDPVTYAKDILRKRRLTRVAAQYHLWVVLGIVGPGVVLCALDGWLWTVMLRGMLFGGALRIFAGHHAVWSINSFGHCFGKRPYETREQSRNNVWLVLPTLGGGWHNNHHAFPASAINSFRWWQFDPVGLVILLSGRLGVVWDIRRKSDKERGDGI